MKGHHRPLGTLNCDQESGVAEGGGGRQAWSGSVLKCWVWGSFAGAAALPARCTRRPAPEGRARARPPARPRGPLEASRFTCQRLRVSINNRYCYSTKSNSRFLSSGRRLRLPWCLLFAEPSWEPVHPAPAGSLPSPLPQDAGASLEGFRGGAWGPQQVLRTRLPHRMLVKGLRGGFKRPKPLMQ